MSGDRRSAALGAKPENPQETLQHEVERSSGILKPW